ncbi:hypothetical protein D9758_008669 [Tetrapyrgos nigripes]|uniref:NADH:flavin oxidoreductase/NADH oxidase N-terminal domain-containing protein n=1 Tax=Tetrapyrgos nigripes TaxID=182062 RepID=A0A8H5D5T3_9AGAR|nr:hypothetical protein D9758_008669 [Tetrapyrgos nigripes]
MTVSKLFQPIKLGDVDLKHRVVIPPLTRFRANKQHILLPIVKEMYAQRASMPGTLLIAEGTFIDPRAEGYPFVPGIWSDEQIAAWKEVTSAVHKKGSFIYLQLGALGRNAYAAVINAQNYDLVGASDIPAPECPQIPGTPEENPPPQPLTIPEIKEYCTISFYSRITHHTSQKTREFFQMFVVTETESRKEKQ